MDKKYYGLRLGFSGGTVLVGRVLSSEPQITALAKSFKRSAYPRFYIYHLDLTMIDQLDTCSLESLFPSLFVNFEGLERYDSHLYLWASIHNGESTAQNARCLPLS